MGTTLIVVVVTLFGFALTAPAENSLVVSSTETSNENGKEVSSTDSLLYPVIYEMNINSNISNRFAKTLVVSKVRNPSQSAREATFTVVLPEKAFISEFVMEIGGKSYKAYVKEKEEAKNIYQQAVASGRSAGYVGVSARDSNKFTVSVNVEPEAKAVFLLTYEELLQRNNDQYELVLNIHPGQIVKKLNVEVLLKESRALKYVKTPSLRSGNEISKNEDKLDPSSNIQIINSTSAIVKFHPDSEQQKQFARDLGTKESNGLSGQFVVQYDVERDPHGGEVLLQDGYFVHFFAPSDLEPLPKHVVFVLDTSGSMGGRKIAQLKDAMNSILSEIRTNDIISIIEFNSNIKVWSIEEENGTEINYDGEENYQEPFYKLSKINLPSSTPASELNIKKAKNVIDKIYAGGGTHMIGGLETALYLIKQGQEKNVTENEKYQPILVFLTDGEPNFGISSTEEITKIVTKLNSENNKVPIFSLSFGYGADKRFLRKLSLKNLGFSRHIYEASDASLQLQEFYKQISSPLLSNINFKYDSEVKDVTKSHFPIFFRGSEIVVSGRYQDSDFPTIIDCWGPRGPIILKPVIESPVTSLERLWAYLTVKQTLDERDSVENGTELTKKALDLALKYSFVTDVTSLVVVKPNDTSAVNTEEATGSTSQQFGYVPYRSFGSSAFSKSSPTSFAALSLDSYSAPDSDLIDIRAESIPFSASDIRPLFPPAPTLQPISLPTTTFRPPSTTQIYLSWLASVLNTNGTITVSQGVYELGENLPTVSQIQCPKIPSVNSNTTETGVCTHLKECVQVHSLLFNFNEYEKYFCPIDNKYAGVCCPKNI